MADTSISFAKINKEIADTPSWLQFPPTVLARSPIDQNTQCRFDLDGRDARLAALDNRYQPAFDLWSVVLGQVPPVFGADRSLPDGTTANLTALHEAHACFQGIRRPIDNDDEGKSVITYVLRPRFQFVRGHGRRFAIGQVQAVKEDLLYLVYVRAESPYLTAGQEVRGTLTHGGFVEMDENDTSLPRDHSKRFDKRLW